MIRVPLSKGLNLSEADTIVPFYKWYAKQVEKDPNYGSKRAARDARRRKHLEDKKKKNP